MQRENQICQDEVDEMLKSQIMEQSMISKKSKGKVQPSQKAEDSYVYDNQQFEAYQDSKQQSDSKFEHSSQSFKKQSKKPYPRGYIKRGDSKKDLKQIEEERQEHESKVKKKIIKQKSPQRKVSASKSPQRKIHFIEFDDDQQQSKKQSKEKRKIVEENNKLKSKREITQKELNVTKQKYPKVVQENKSNKTQQNFKNHNDYLPHNYAKLAERQRELLLTSLYEENKVLKNKVAEKEKQSKDLKQKYNQLFNDKQDLVKNELLEKEKAELKKKLGRMTQLYKNQQEKNKHRMVLKKNQTAYIPQSDLIARQKQLIDIIDHLKQRLIKSDENMGVLKKKLSEGIEYHDQLKQRFVRVQKLEYQIQKMGEQIQADRILIDVLKEKVKDAEKTTSQEKDKRIRLESKITAFQVSQMNNQDVALELKQSREENKKLNELLKQMSGNFMNSVLNKKPCNISEQIKMEDSNQLLKP